MRSKIHFLTFAFSFCDDVAECFFFGSEEEDKEEETKSSPTSSEPVNTDTTSEETNDASPEDQDTVNTDGRADAVTTQGAEGEGSEPIEEQQTSEISDFDQSPISSPADPPVEEKKKKITYQTLLKEGRRFNIDLVSKVCVQLYNNTLCNKSQINNIFINRLLA